MPEIDLDAYYVVHTDNDVVVAGPIADEGEAMSVCDEYGDDEHAVFAGGPLRQHYSGRALGWDTDGVRIVTDGGDSLASPAAIDTSEDGDLPFGDGVLGPKLAAARLRRSHDQRFGSRCTHRSLTTTEGGARTVIYCETCRFVVARPQLDDGQRAVTDGGTELTTTERVREWINETLDGEQYVKAREIADATGLSTNQAGCGLAQLADRDDGPAVEKWSGSPSATWLITPESEVVTDENNKPECQRCGDSKVLECYKADSGEEADLCDECFDEVVADGGVPEYINEIQGLDGDVWYSCDTCGATGDTVPEVDHHEDCPDDGWDPEPADLREGETPDENSHTSRIEAQLEMAEEQDGDDDA